MTLPRYDPTHEKKKPPILYTPFVFYYLVLPLLCTHILFFIVSLAYIWRFILDGFGILASLQRKFTLGLAHVAFS